MAVKTILFVASVSGALSVALGAFGAHILKSLLTADQLNIFETAVRYQFYHSLALLATGLISALAQTHVHGSGWLSASAYAFVAGLVLFSGSLYLIIFLQYHHSPVPGWIGILTPIGGLCFIAGWICLALSVWKI
ncbi:MAG: DUF423 domain-containing protein [Thermoflavifilum sp.]|nr:DUF423 domain-containing protein [Thermoflavifilum sp.]